MPRPRPWGSTAPPRRLNECLLPRTKWPQSRHRRRQLAQRRRPRSQLHPDPSPAALFDTPLPNHCLSPSITPQARPRASDQEKKGGASPVHTSKAPAPPLALSIFAVLTSRRRRRRRADSLARSRSGSSGRLMAATARRQAAAGLDTRRGKGVRVAGLGSISIVNRSIGV